ncbi:MAG: hypothetical protein ACOZE5_03025 [Verrucomicrobiota bacterium]
MKLKPSALALAGLSLGAALTAWAGPGPDYWQRVRTAEEFKQLKKGDKVLYVCNQCETVTEKIIASETDAMDHCKEGATLTCPSCKKQVKVTYKGGRNDPPVTREIIYTNEKGEPCFFVAKTADKPGHKH